ncbi:MAG: hypothetical protein LBH57_05410, partial [Treponema sp.]|nr:hypothetical protein [Treponema sp.]
EGNVNVDWIWGEVPYRNYYVASYGNDGNPGTKESPVATVKQALLNLKNNYAAFWPEKGTELENPGAIIILDEVEVTEQIYIDGSVGYPPIILCDDPETSGGTLRVNANMTFQKIEYGKSLVHIRNGAKVTLAGGLVLAGTEDYADEIRGVYIASSTFTMNGGEISGNFLTLHGGGVFMNNSMFTMNGGKISGNKTSYEGGGVATQNGPYSTDTFIMNGGEISDNSANNSGGGVLFSSSGTARFIMNDGKISDNSASKDGGGVMLSSYGTTTFTMNGGEISGNSANAGDIDLGGGGVCSWGSPFTMNNGKIFNNSGKAGGVAMYHRGAIFTMNNGEITDNTSTATHNNGSSGGVTVWMDATLIMNGGKISRNSTLGFGGGVTVRVGKFSMTDGEISGNTCGVQGGGVYIAAPTVFSKSGGTIYGYDGGNPLEPNNNKVADGSGNILNNRGHAVYLDGTHRKETTVGPEDILYYNSDTDDMSGWD